MMPNRRIDNILLCFIIILFLSPSTIPGIYIFAEKFGFETLKNKTRRLVSPYMRSLTLAVEKPEFTIDSWLNGDFQNNLEKYYSRHFGIREFYIRLNNQIYYSIFKKSYMGKGTVIIGRENQLYEKHYIDEYFKKNKPLTEDELIKLVNNILAVQNAFKDKGVAFLVLITPSKAYTYPEYIPDEFKREVYSSRDYDNMVPLFDKFEINYIDAQDIIIKSKKNYNHPLFPKGGVHWNDLGVYCAANPFLNKIKYLINKKISLILLKEINFTYPSGSDCDLLDICSLLFPDKKYLVPSLILSPENTDSIYKPDIVFIGGSFCWQFIKILNDVSITRSIEFYYYYILSHHYFPPLMQPKKPFDVKDINWENDFLKKDAVILEINESVFQSNHVRCFLEDALKNIQ